MLEPRPVAKRTGYSSLQVPVSVRLNTNESPYAPPVKWQMDFVKEIPNLELNRYPDGQMTKLVEALARYHKLDASYIWAANGSNETIQLLLHAYGGHGRVAAIYEPSYAMHFYISQITGTEIKTYARNNSFKINSEQVLSDFRRDKFDILFLCSPNNPTGTIEDYDEIKYICQQFTGLLIIDEAYVQFSKYSFEGFVKEFDNVAIIRTFSKTWAMAGVRLGYIIANPKIIDAVKNVSLPYHVSSFSQLAGVLALNYEDEMRERIKLIKDERTRVISDLKNVEKLQVWDSEANFFLIKPTNITGKELHERLLDKSVLVRDVGHFKLLENCLRVTIGTPVENDRFLTAVKEALE